MVVSWKYLVNYGADELFVVLILQEKILIIG